MGNKFMIHETKMNEAEIVLIEKARALDVLCNEIKGEAQRRILVKVPEQMQRNLLMQALHLVVHMVPANDFKLCDRKAWQEIDESWQEIDAIRHVSDELEFAAEEGNLPRNWKQDVYWG